VPTVELAKLAHQSGISLVVDLGSGSIADLRRYGLPHEETPKEVLDAGADVVTFSGDKLLGGPQAGLIVGKADIIRQIKGNPLKRALRVDKMTIAALSAVLRLYQSPQEMVRKSPALRQLTRPSEDIRRMAERLSGLVQAVLPDRGKVSVETCESQIGSGALPTDMLPSFGLRLEPTGRARATRKVEDWAAAFRRLPQPVIGRIAGGALLFDLRCLEEEKAFAAQLSQLELAD
jgi:L-seryl-tRNA(Ser) seleniumtransferase